MIHVALVHPEIAVNVADAGRTCVVAGARLHIVKPIGFVLGNIFERPGMSGYWNKGEPVIHESLDAFLAILPTLGEPRLLSTHGKKSFYEVPLPEDIVLIFGNERYGLPDSLRSSHSQHVVSLPGSPHVVSLTLPTAVGVAVYETLRRHNSPDNGATVAHAKWRL